MAPIEKRMKRASIVIASGLLVQVLTFLVKHPLSFVAFLLVGCTLLGAGVFLFLLTLVTHNPDDGPSPAP